MRIVVTGGDGFIGQNLRTRLKELGHTDVVSVTRRTSDDLAAVFKGADFVFHLAGVNRPKDVAEFQESNTHLTQRVCAALLKTGRRIPVAFASSTQALLENPYGRSKRDAETAVEGYGAATGSPVFILRLTNVFGKWARPDYNSAVATFCHNIARGLPIRVHDPATPLTLLYVDDAATAMVGLLEPGQSRSGLIEVGPTYSTTLGEVVDIIESFHRSREDLVIPAVGIGLARALHATYLSYLRPTDFAYRLQRHDDARGTFVEMLKTRDSGQFSYFTAPPGVTRGEHYHHTKTEKFLVVQGKAHFGFRHIRTNERHEVVVDSQVPQIVETIPGWAHNITNIGAAEMIVMLWASEIFDPARTDTIAEKVDS
jgi:UDP-2-acetamido-2,6-beta-L-arabino-hexul-4-ose reductase